LLIEFEQNATTAAMLAFCAWILNSDVTEKAISRSPKAESAARMQCDVLSF
jgi:hypothetical protein